MPINVAAVNEQPVGGGGAPGYTSSTYTTALGAGAEPYTRQFHDLLVTYSKSASGGETVDLIVRLLEGNTVRFDRGPYTNISATPTSAVETLTLAEASSIGDYGNLRIEFEFRFYGDGTAREGRVYHAELQVPEAAEGAYTIAPDDVRQGHGLSRPSVVPGAPIEPDQVRIGGIEVRVLEDPPLEIVDLVEERSTASFHVIDTSGARTFQRGERVLIFDADGQRAFAGYVDTVQEVRINQAGAMRHAIVCMDNHYKADKRRVAKAYQDTSTEEIVRDLVTSYLEAEDVHLSSALIDP